MTFKEGERKEKQGRQGEGENGETSCLKFSVLFLKCSLNNHCMEKCLRLN